MCLHVIIFIHIPFKKAIHLADPTERMQNEAYLGCATLYTFSFSGKNFQYSDLTFIGQWELLHSK